MARPTLEEQAERRFTQAEVQLRDKSARYSTKALERIYAIMMNDKTADSPALRACEMILKQYNDLRLEDAKKLAEKAVKPTADAHDSEEDEDEGTAVLKIGDKEIKIG